jgi:radical SAM superfamily enzyme YgiQ (UPF0313 family)
MRTSDAGTAFREPSPPPVTPPLGILYLASSLRRELGDRVEVEVESLSTGVRTMDDVPLLLEERAPDIVGISSLLVEEDRAVAVARAARSLERPPRIVVGGPYPTCDPLRALTRTGADFAVVGEGERALVGLVRALLDGKAPSGLAGVASLDRGGGLETGGPCEFIEDVDAIPPPAWDLVDLGTYSRLFNFNDFPVRHHPYAPILTSRGCPFRCAYCHDIFGKRFRGRSPGSVLEEMEMLVGRHGVREFHIFDDIVNADSRRLEAICRLIIERGLDIALVLPNGIRGDLLTREQVDLLGRAGLYSMTLGVESGSPRVLERMGRKTDLERLAGIAAHATSIGIVTNAFVMFGYPGETREDLEMTIRWLRDSAIDFPRLCIASPLPGTEMARHAAEEGLDCTDLDIARSNYDWPNRGLSRMSDEEFEQRVKEGMTEILEEPRRRKRLADICASLGPDELRYMAQPPGSRT